MAVLLALPGVAAAHPIEPLVTAAPMPVPKDYVAADFGYSALHGEDGFDQDVPFTLSAGIGGHAEIFVGGGIDATGREIMPIFVGGKALLLMEGPHGIDLSLQASFASDETAHGTLLLGRSILPGFYLQGAAGLDGATAPGMAVPVPVLGPRHEVGTSVTGNEIALRLAGALQWAPRPRLIPTLEGQLAHTFADAGDQTSLVVVPELIWLLEINHLSVKLAVPVGLAGQTDYGFLASLDWER